MLAEIAILNQLPHLPIRLPISEDRLWMLEVFFAGGIYSPHGSSTDYGRVDIFNALTSRFSEARLSVPRSFINIGSNWS